MARPTISTVRFTQHARDQQNARQISDWLVSVALELGDHIVRGAEHWFILTSSQLRELLAVHCDPLKVVIKGDDVITVIWLDR